VGSYRSAAPRSSGIARDGMLRVRGLIASSRVSEDGGSDTGRNRRCERSASASVVPTANRSPVRVRCVLFIAVLLAVTSCSGGRVADAIVATTFGHVVPAGAALVQEMFQPRYDYSSGFVTSRNCGRLVRVFASNDIDAFLNAVLEAARNSGWQVPTMPATAELGAGRAVRLSGELTVVSMVFYDFDHPTYQPRIYNDHTDGRFEGPLIDSKTWRFLVRMVVRDAADKGWSDCVNEARINPSF
jgi:hypothetical protein